MRGADLGVALVLAVTVPGGPAPARAGYRELARELDAYQPPALAAGTRSTARAPASATPDDGAFAAEISRLREAKARWERALADPPAEGAFYAPSPSALAALGPAARDDAAAAVALAEAVSLETLEILALLRSPAVRAREREVRAAAEGYSQVESLDTVLRRYAAFTASSMAGVGGAERPDAPGLQFPFPGVLALKGQVVSQEVRAAAEGLEAARRDAVTEARKMYWGLAFAERSREITGRMYDLLEGLKSAASARYAAGETTYQDVVRAGIQREKTREELVTLQNEIHHMHAGIAELLALPLPAHFGPALPRDPPRGIPEVAPLYPLARKSRQEVRALAATIGKMERMLEMAETMIYPGFGLGLSVYERNEASRVGAGAANSMDVGGAADPMRGAGAPGGSFATVTSASMGAGLPKMPWFGGDDAYLRETRQRIEAMRQELRMAEAATDFAVHDAWVRLDNAAREEGLYRDRVVPLAQAALEAATRGYSTGKVMFSDLVESYTGWFEASLAAERARSDQGVAWAELEAAVGTTVHAQGAEDGRR